MTQALVTENRVIVANTATKEELQALSAKHPDKSVVREGSLKLFPGVDDAAARINAQLASQAARISTLEKMVANLMAERAAQTIRTQETAAVEKEPDTVTISEKTVTESDMRKATSPLAEKIAARHNASVSTQPKKPAAVQAPAPVTNSERKRDKYDDMEKEELMKRCIKRGGNPAKIMRPFHARARTIALRDWLRKNPPQKQGVATTSAKTGKRPAASALAKGLRRKSASRRAAH